MAASVASCRYETGFPRVLLGKGNQEGDQRGATSLLAWVSSIDGLQARNHRRMRYHGSAALTKCVRISGLLAGWFKNGSWGKVTPPTGRVHEQGVRCPRFDRPFHFNDWLTHGSPGPDVEEPNLGPSKGAFRLARRLHE